MKNIIRHFRWASFFLLVFLTGNLAFATLAPHAPSLSVHDSAYGVVQNGTRRESIQKISIHLVSYAAPGTDFTVQSFFLRRPKPGEMPQVDDAVIFDVTTPHATYEVQAKPILLPDVNKGTGGKGKSSKKSNPNAPKQTSSGREGFVVRVLCHGIVLRQQASGHQLGQLAKLHPELFDEAAASRSARHLPSESLIKH
jgi:hypothetical protein